MLRPTCAKCRSGGSACAPTSPRCSEVQTYENRVAKTVRDEIGRRALTVRPTAGLQIGDRGCLSGGSFCSTTPLPFIPWKSTNAHCNPAWNESAGTGFDPRRSNGSSFDGRWSKMAELPWIATQSRGCPRCYSAACQLVLECDVRTTWAGVVCRVGPGVYHVKEWKGHTMHGHAERQSVSGKQWVLHQSIKILGRARSYKLHRRSLSALISTDDISLLEPCQNSKRRECWYAFGRMQ